MIHFESLGFNVRGSELSFGIFRCRMVGLLVVCVCMFVVLYDSRVQDLGF